MPTRANLFNSADNSNRKSTPLGLEQLEARLTYTISSLQHALGLLAPGPNSAGTVRLTTTNNAPVVASPARLAFGSDVRGIYADVTVRATDDGGEGNLRYSWSVVKSPAVGSVSFARNDTSAAKNNRVSFTAAGNYELQVTITDKAGFSTKSNVALRVVQTPARLSINGGSVIANSGTSQTLRAEVLDQFGAALATQPAIVWKTASSPTGSQPTLTAAGNSLAATFDRAGDYTFRATSGNLTASAQVRVSQTLTSMAVTPGTASVAAGGAQQFQAQGRDQFQRALATQPTIQWSATGGTIDANGLYRASYASGNFSVRATSGSISATAAVTVAAAPQDNQPGPSALTQLLTTYYADGSISRTDMIQLLRSAGNDGAVDANELATLRSITSASSRYVMPDYVRDLASDVVNSNPANLRFQGQAAGNLVAGSPSSLLNKLIDKWFLGADLPALSGSGLTYSTAVGALFNGTPSLSDARQGMLGDCYLIAGLVSIAQRDADAVRNMFVDNGDGTFTVRFYGGTYGSFFSGGTISTGFTSGAGTADYITVNRQLPTFSNGVLAYSGYGSLTNATTTTLWIALAEKAYAQWNETGKAGRDGSNAYASIEGGWMSDVYAQALGHNATDYWFSNTPKQTMIDVLNSGRAVTLGTKGGTREFGLVTGHAYTVSGYNQINDTFTLHNPWGTQHPAPLTWTQIVANAYAFSVTDPRGSTAVGIANVRSEATPAAVYMSPEHAVPGRFSTGVADAQRNELSSIDHLEGLIEALAANERGDATSAWNDSIHFSLYRESSSSSENGLSAALVDEAMTLENIEDLLS